MNLEPITQMKEVGKRKIAWRCRYIGSRKTSPDDPTCRAAKETQTGSPDFGHSRGRGGGVTCENGNEIYM